MADPAATLLGLAIAAVGLMTIAHVAKTPTSIKSVEIDGRVYKVTKLGDKEFRVERLDANGRTIAQISFRHGEIPYHVEYNALADIEDLYRDLDRFPDLTFPKVSKTPAPAPSVGYWPWGETEQWRAIAVRKPGSKAVTWYGPKKLGENRAQVWLSQAIENAWNQQVELYTHDGQKWVRT